MTMIRRGIQIVVVIVCCYSCSQRDVWRIDNDRASIFTEENRVFETETDSIEQVYVKGSIVCKFFPRKPNGPVLELNNIEALKNTRSLYRYDDSDNGFVLADVSCGQNQILLHDFVRNKIAIVDLTEIYSQESSFPDLLDFSIVSQEVIPYNDKWIYLNPYSFVSRKEKRILVSNDEENAHRRHSFDAFNVLDGTLILDEPNKQIIFLSRYEPIIEYLSLTRHRITRRLYILRDQPAKIVKIHEDGIDNYCFTEFVPVCFVGGDLLNGTLVAAYQDGNGASYLLLIADPGVEPKIYKVSGDVKNVSWDSLGIYLYTWERRGNKDALIRYTL